MKLKALMGCGDKIMLFSLPFIAVGVFLNVMMPALFGVGGPRAALKWVAVAVLIMGLAIWAWSVALLLANIPRNKLITSGPYAIVKHPLYTNMALFVLPAAGVLFNSWLGLAVGAALYAGARLFSREEEKTLSQAFGEQWNAYAASVRIPWL
jgi:protein-S-isoprenylcysteine O-methyltransferase Ste14